MKLPVALGPLLLVPLLVSGAVPRVTAATMDNDISDGGAGGGWRSIELTKDAVTRLLTTLKKEYSYRATVKVRVCMFTFDKVYEQDFTAGTNFQYHGLACRVDNAANAGICLNQVHTYELCAMHDIRLYEQAGTVNATQVLKIDILDGQPPKDADDVIDVNENAVASTSPSPSSATSQPPAIEFRLNALGGSSSLRNDGGRMKSTTSSLVSNDTIEQTLPSTTKQEQYRTSFAILPASSQQLMALAVSFCFAAYLAL